MVSEHMDSYLGQDSVFVKGRAVFLLEDLYCLVFKCERLIVMPRDYKRF